MEEELLAKQATMVVTPCEEQFNLKPLNAFVQNSISKWKDQGLLQLGMLKDEYHLVAIAREHCKYLKFIYNGLIFKFTCLSFGL